jgi:kinesin family protein 2/24
MTRVVGSHILSPSKPYQGLTYGRSHSVMRFSVTSKNGGAPSLLCILDLAGSERAATASGNADPARRREAISINTSLAALKDCIRARLAGDARVPWRGSTLTMVLRRAFAAPPLEEVEDAAPRPEPQLVVLACASPSIFDVEDTLGTLNYVTPFRVHGVLFNFAVLLTSSTAGR